MGHDTTAARRALVRSVARLVPAADARILSAFERVPREAFVPAELARQSYEDAALPIGLGQTISQPSMIALMLVALACEPGQRVLEVGTGSGYVAALLSALGCKVVGIERHPGLVARARETLLRIGVADAVLLEGDGTLGVAEHAPYDRILVSAAADAIPEPLLAQLSDRGRLVMPVGSQESQILVTCERDDKGTLHYRVGPACVFVPLVSGTPAVA